jgi:hypothetical protein
MSQLSTPVSMVANTFNALKGWPRPNALDFVAALDPSVTIALPVGSCVHLNSAGNFVPGVGNAVVMPLFTIPGSTDNDVQNYGGNPATVNGVWVAAEPAGFMSALVAVGAYELSTTNYDIGSAYPPNQPLTSPTTPSGIIAAGMLTAGTLGTNTICGIVSRGVVNNGYGFNALAFWPVFLPPNA